MAGVESMKRLPLDGIRVLDLTMMWAGPYATRVLAEMGAEVLKIESPSAWDNIRTLIPLEGIEEPWNGSYYFNDYNRDKKSVTLDLSQARGRDLFLGLVAQSDVVIENYRASVMDNLGLGYEHGRIREVRRRAGPRGVRADHRADERARLTDRLRRRRGAVQDRRLVWRPGGRESRGCRRGDGPHPAA